MTNIILNGNHHLPCSSHTDSKNSQLLLEANLQNDLSVLREALDSPSVLTNVFKCIKKET